MSLAPFNALNLLRNEAVRSDYVGEFVLTNDIVYLVTPSGAVREVASRPQY
jgi:hypothetical protein